MELSAFDIYLIVVNILGLILFTINTWLYTYTPEGEIDNAVTVICLLGGSLGIVIAMLVFDRSVVKENMMSRVFVSCMTVIDILIVLMIKGFLGKDITFAFWTFFDKHRILLWYLIVINFITLIFFAIDKIVALENSIDSYEHRHRKARMRVRIITLLGLAFIGGSIGALIGIYGFRHKTKKDYFTVGVPLIIVMQILFVFFIMNFNGKEIISNFVSSLIHKE